MRPATPTAAHLTNDLSQAKASSGAPLAGLWGGWGFDRRPRSLGRLRPKPISASRNTHRSRPRLRSGSHILDLVSRPARWAPDAALASQKALDRLLRDLRVEKG
jgi:hypothetical protein